MPAFSVADSSDIASGLSDAFKNAYEGPKTAAALMTARADVAYKNAQRKQLEDQMFAAQQYNTANRAYWGAQQPPVAPSVAIAGTPGQFDPSIPLEGPPSPPTPAEQGAVTGDFNRMRDLSLANAQLGAVHTTSFEDAAKAGPKTLGQTGLALRGMPTTPADKAIVGAQLKGEFEKPDTKVQGNWVEIDKNGNTVPGSGGMLTSDGLDATTGRDPRTLVKTPGGTAMKGQEAKVGAEGSIFGSPGGEKAATFRLAQKAAKEGLSADEEAQLKYVSRFVFPWASEVTKNAQGQFVVISKQSNEQPQLLTDALASIDRPGGGATSGAAFTQGAAPLGVPGLTPGAGAAAGANTGVPDVSGFGRPAAAPASGGAPSPPAQPSSTGAINLPNVKISAPIGTGEASPESLRKDTTAAILANNAMSEFYKRFNYTPRNVDAQGNVTPGQFLDPRTGQPNMTPSAVTNVVPSFKAGVAAETLPTGMISQGITNWLDPKSQDYNALSYRFVEPVIRMASGAAISPREYSQYFQMFIPNANDSPTTAAQKLDAMHDWVQAVSTSSTARGAIDTVMQIGTDNPITRQLAQTFAERARVKGTLDTPFSQLPGAGGGAAPAQAAPAAGGQPAPNKNADVEQMLA